MTIGEAVEIIATGQEGLQAQLLLVGGGGIGISVVVFGLVKAWKLFRGLIHG